jgi:hypothetical protein
MRAWVLCLIGYAATCAAVACSGEQREEERSSAPPAEVAGADLVRGMSGLPREGGATTAEEKAQWAIVDEVVAEIEAKHPGRLATIKADLTSRDPERVQNAKILLDATIAEAADSPQTQERIVKSGATTVSPSAIHVLDLTNGSQEPLVDGGGQIVDAGQQLLCEHPKGADGQPLRLGAVNGTYGDGRTGALAAAADTPDLADSNDWNIMRTLRRVDSGELVPDPESRLGAYAATRGYGAGTVGNAVHNAIGTIFVTFGNYGQERIGRVFNSPEARALYDQPVASCAGAQMAMLEHQYWQDVRREDPWSPGGNMGSAFNPKARDLLQRRLFNLF